MRDGFVTADLVLVGGGHAHVHVLRSFGMRPVPGVRLTLIAREAETPYSGMLPGLVAGHYAPDECHVDLRRLARFAGARFVHDEAVGIDRDGCRVRCRAHPPVRYDLLSLDIGSTPRATDLPGAAEHATPAKPVDRFRSRWRRVLERARASADALRVVVVGGGAGGVELALAVQHGLGAAVGRPAAVRLVTRGGLLERHNAGVRRAFRRILQERAVELHLGTEVLRVEPGWVAWAGGGVSSDEPLLVTQAGAAPWLADTGLALDPGGFVAVDATLRSVNDPLVFAAGDVAAVLGHPREKAGVFAVRQGPPLAANLRRALAGGRPVPFVPQRRFLSLISTGDRHAVASRGPFFAEGAWLWRVKDRIDRRWMRRYQELPAMVAPPRPTPEQVGDAPEAMRCGGCGAKVPSGALARALRRLETSAGGTVPQGLEAPEDAAILRLPPGQLVLQTVDFFRAFVDDPYLLGRIAANHALGDVYAMGGQPHTALATACVPPAREAIVEEDLFHMLRGGLDVLETAGASLVGGHSAEASELALGFAVTGTAAADRLLRKGGLRAGDRLILAKPLGTGTLLAAEMRGRARSRWIEGALAAMQVSARGAAAVLLAHGATACTDVTGFGLLGHLLEMLAASGADAVLDLGALPVLDGALETLAAGIVSSLHAGNAEAARSLGGEASAAEPRLSLLFDPQTAGGLLAGVPAGRAAACLRALRAHGYADAAVIGKVGVGGEGGPRVRLGLAEADGNRTRHPV